MWYGWYSIEDGQSIKIFTLHSLCLCLFWTVDELTPLKQIVLFLFISQFSQLQFFSNKKYRKENSENFRCLYYDSLKNAMVYLYPPTTKHKEIVPNTFKARFAYGIASQGAGRSRNTKNKKNNNYNHRMEIWFCWDQHSETNNIRTFIIFDTFLLNSG